MKPTTVAELDLFIDYAVEPEDRDKAREMIKRFSKDPLALNLLTSFYTSLPDAKEDCILKIFQPEQHQGTFLFLVQTNLSAYFYMVNTKDAKLVATEGEGLPQDILEFFGFVDLDSFQKKHGDFKDQPLYKSAFASTCPACYTTDGHLHEFGCPVEVCPWCDGQLTGCNCRFDQMGIAEFSNDKQLIDFQNLLVKKGRIPFDAALHRPSYPTAGDDTLD
jgi:hypothetical protein